MHWQTVVASKTQPEQRQTLYRSGHTQNTYTHGGGLTQGHADGRCYTNTSHWSIPHYRPSQPVSLPAISSLLLSRKRYAAENMSASPNVGKKSKLGLKL